MYTIYFNKIRYLQNTCPHLSFILKDWVLEIINDRSSPILPLIDFYAIYKLAEDDSDYGKPWFGQLMATPQMFAYLIQVDTWLRKYKG
jgi:asparagine synthase (glutamine-hydrolysing)